MHFAKTRGDEAGPHDVSPAAAALAERHALTSFLNALMRDWQGWSLLPETEARRIDPDGRPVARLPLPDAGITAHAVLAHHSSAGRHTFALPLLASGPGAAPGTTLDLDRFARLVTAEPTIVGRLPAGARDAFLGRVADSRANIAAALSEHRAERGATLAGPVDFAAAEQALVLGHPVHPTPKSRDGFSPADARAFSPDHAAAMPLAWFVVHDSALHSDSAGGTPAAGLTARLMADDPSLGEAFVRRVLPGPDWSVLPAHPWQAERLLRLPEVAALIGQGCLRLLGTTGAAWRPTTSLRSLYAPHAAHMVKFSIGVRLTNSTRVLQPCETARGLTIHRILQGPIGRELSARLPGFRVMGEPAHLSLRLPDGRPLAASTVVLRDNPFRGGGPFEACVLATLCQDDPWGGAGLLARIVRTIAVREGMAEDEAALAWFDRFLEVVLEPLLIAQADYGLLFSAHQQNVVLGMERGWPAVLYFRDCQGTGFTEPGRAAVARVHRELADGLDNVFDPATTAKLVDYYLVVNAVFGTVSALASAGLVPERPLFARLRAGLERLLALGLRDSSSIEHLLTARMLWSKANFRLAAGCVEETLATGNPTDAYVAMANPIVQPTTTPEIPMNHVSMVRMPAPGAPRASGQRGFGPGRAIMVETVGTRRIVHAADRPAVEADVMPGPDGIPTLGLRRTGPACTPMALAGLLASLFDDHPDAERIRIAPGDAGLPADTAPLVHGWETPEGGSEGGPEGGMDRYAVCQRSAFLQVPLLWHAPGAVVPFPAMPVPCIHGGTHPQRPPAPHGTVYERFLPDIGMTLTFRTVDRVRDLDLFHSWMNDGRVAYYWELAKPKDELAAYLEQLDADPHAYALIGSLDGDPACYFETYWAKEDRLGAYYEADDFDRGWHVLVGNTAHLGRKKTASWFRSINHYLFLDDPRTRRIVGEPRAEHVRMLRYAEQTGFVKVKEFDFPHKRSALMRCDRDPFFARTLR